ncbi:MAG: HDOD domain-containing protein [Desulfoarculaceae bacterium]|nr:HDOD domain-containing protein [Desulfoarculaceae bacterium]
MDIFVARQPIFNRYRRVIAYELLFRNGMSNSFPGVDGDEATSSLLSSSFFTVGIEQIASGHKAFINFTEDMLLRGVPAMFPARSVVVEILEDVEPREEVVAACHALMNKGYVLALDNFVYAENFIPLLELAKIIKVDFRQSSHEQIVELVEIARKYHCKLLAGKIETHEEYARAYGMGFVYFQGYFFAKPEILKNKEISSSQMIYMKLIMEVNRAEFEINNLESLLKQDVAISYKLLKYLNSAYYSRLQPLSSIRQAIAFLGERGTRMFVSLIATSSLSENKPDELIRLSCIRARFLELIGKELQQDQGLFFLLGLFSLLDAILDAPMESLMRQLPVSGDITVALVHNSGPLFPYLHLIQLYETGQWAELDLVMTQLQMDGANIMDYYLDAVRWSGYFIG